MEILYFFLWFPLFSTQNDSPKRYVDCDAAKAEMFENDEIKPPNEQQEISRNSAHALHFEIILMRSLDKILTKNPN